MKRSNAGTGGTVADKDEFVREIAKAIVDGSWGAGSTKAFAESKGLEILTVRQYANMAKRILRIVKPGESF